MTIQVDFNREKYGTVDILFAMVMNVSSEEIRKMSDEELLKRAFQFAEVYGFSNLKIINK